MAETQPYIFLFFFFFKVKQAHSDNNKCLGQVPEACLAKISKLEGTIFILINLVQIKSRAIWI